MVIYLTEEQYNLNRKIQPYNLSYNDVISFFDYSSYDDLYPQYSYDEVDDDGDYMYSSKEALVDEIEKMFDTFDALPDPIPVFRTIRVDSESKIDLENPGDFWSFDKDSALNFADNHALGNYLLSGYVDKENVNWKQTFKSFTEFSINLDEYTENEITISDWNVVKNIKYEKIR